MSRERCLSLDRAQRRQQRNNLIRNSLYSLERSPNRKALGSRFNVIPQHVPSAPDIYSRNYGGGILQNHTCDIDEEQSVEGFAKDNDYIPQHELNIHSLPEEILDDFEEPSFYEIPTNASFDEVMCTMATPPPAPTAAEKLDDLRRRMAAHIRSPAEVQQSQNVQVDDVRRRIAAIINEDSQKPPLCKYKIQPLPDDPYAIPPPPKNSKDVEAIIRRAHAIARLKALEEKKLTSKPLKNVKQLQSRRQVPTIVKPKAKINTANKLLQKTPASKPKQKRRQSPDHVPDEWTAAVLRTRKLAGFKTESKSPRQRSPSPTIPATATIENIRERLAAFKSRAKATAALEEQTRNILIPTPEDDLDEYELLEQLYGAGQSEQCFPVEENVLDLQNRIGALQQQLLQSPPKANEKLNAYENFQLMHGEVEMPAAAQCDVFSKYSTRSGSPLTAHDTTLTTPKRSRSPAVTLRKFDDAMLRDIDIPDFNINDIPDFAYTAEAMADAGFEIGDISMPSLEEDISFDEFGLDDITSPDLCDLSVSGTDLALEPDYPLEEATEDEDYITEKSGEDQIRKQPGFLTSMVNAVVDRFRNIFSPIKCEDEQNEEKELILDTSLPNMFETTPPLKPKTPPSRLAQEKQVNKRSLTPKDRLAIPPHPKNPKDYVAMVKRARAIQKKKLEEISMSKVANEALAKTKIKSTIPKRAPPLKKKALVPKKKKEEKPEKMYPPGEYSPSDTIAVARARTLAGLKNRSDLLNPERVARKAERKAAREAELAAIESLPPVERMKKKMESMRKRMGGLPRPSIETLGTLEAIRANLPIPKTSKRKWRPTGRLRADRRTKPKDRIFTADLGRVLIPTKRTQNKKGWRAIDVMSPITEEPQYLDENFIQFSPSKPFENQMRLQYLKEQTAKRAAETIRRAKEAQEAIPMQSSPSYSADYSYYSPIKLQSPCSPRTEKTKREKTVTKVGPNGGEETIKEKITETSTFENGEVHTTTRQVTTKTDEFGNVTCHIQEGKGLSGEEEALQECLADIEPPDFLETSDIPSPIDPSLPTPAEIINRIRSKVQQKLNFALPDVPKSPRSPYRQSPIIIDFPQDLPDEELIDIEISELDQTSQLTSPHVKEYSPIEKDKRMYAWGENPPLTPPPRISTPKISRLSPEPVQQINLSSKLETPERIICIPSHPKDPKDYKTMVKRAQAIQKLKQQELQDIAAKTEAPSQPLKKERVPISRWVAPPPIDPRRQKIKRLVLKKRVPKVSPKKIEQQQKEEDNEDSECPAEPPLLPQDYREAVARTRLKHGLSNKTAALNPEVAAKLAAQEAAKAAFDALPEFEKIQKRMEKLREIPAKQRKIDPSADIIGTLEAIRANLPQNENVLRQPFPCHSVSEHHVPIQGMTPQTPITRYPSISLPQAPIRARPQKLSPSLVSDSSLDEFEYLEQCMVPVAVTPTACVPIQENSADESLNVPDISLLKPYISPEQGQHKSPHQPLSSLHCPTSASVCLPSSQSLEEFENLENELKIDLSLEEFEALEAEALNLYNYDTPKRGERYLGRKLIDQLPISPKPTKPELKLSENQNQASSMVHGPSPQPEGFIQSSDLLAPSMRMLGQSGFLQEYGPAFNKGFVLESPKKPFITPRADAKPGSIFYDAMQDFKVSEENFILETSQLMPETPPKNIQERFEKLKKAQEKQTTSREYAQIIEDTKSTPVANYSPIKLISPSGVVCNIPGLPVKPNLIAPLPIENEWLINVDKTPNKIAAAKQFRDLEDIPFDELEYEIEPSLTNISLDKPISPPPKPSEIISRIRSKVRQHLKENTGIAAIQPETLQMPKELTDEELFEQSLPSFVLTPNTPPRKYKSPRVSLPMAWGEVRPCTPVTPVTSQIQIPTSGKKTTPRAAQKVNDKIPTPEGFMIPPHPKDPNDYAAMIRRAQAIHKLKKKEKEAAKALPLQSRKNVRVPISRWQGPPPKGVSAKPRRKLVLKKRVVEDLDKQEEFQQPLLSEEEDGECPAEPPLLPQEYRDAVARARLKHGFKNRTAALNPQVAAEVAAYNALPELEKIKVRMEHLRKNSRSRRGVQPSMEQIAYLEAIKQIGQTQYSSTSLLAKSPKPPRDKEYISSPTPRRLSITPRADYKQTIDDEGRELAEFEALEQFKGSPIYAKLPQADFDVQKRIAVLEQQLLDTEVSPQIKDLSLAEFEALEASFEQYSSEPVTTLDMNKLISDLQQKLLNTPPIDPRERYRQIMAERKTPYIPVASPIKTPEIRYEPITLCISPKEEPKNRAEKTTTQITRSGKNTIKEQVIETSEIVEGELKHFVNCVTTTTDPQGNVTCQINESKRISAQDRSAELDDLESLGNIEEPSFLDTTPVTPMERPRPKDIIDRVRRQVEQKYKPDVPTGQLIDLRTPPRTLALPKEVPEEELFDLSCPEFETTPIQSLVELSPKCLFRSPNISIPQLFVPTPPPPTPPLRPLSPLRHRIPSPEGPIVIPPHPKNPNDFKAMCRRARKVKQLQDEIQAQKAATAAAEATKPKKKERVPISRWTVAPPRKQGKRKKKEVEYPTEPPPLPEYFAQEVALARTLAGLKNRTAALNPKVADRERARAETMRQANDDKSAKQAALFAPPRSPITDYATVVTRMKDLKEKGAVPRGQPSISAVAYLNALKSVIDVQKEQQPLTDVSKHESPKTRFKRILDKRLNTPPKFIETPTRTPTCKDIPYSPVRFVSPRIDNENLNFLKAMEKYECYQAAFKNLNELEDLEEFEQPSYIDVSQCQVDDDQYVSLTPPQTPPLTPSAIIKRMRQQYEQQKAYICSESPPLTPETLEFPKELPEEDLFELSAPSFAKSPIKSKTPIMSPNISLPNYFETTTTPAKLITPKSVSRSRSSVADMVANQINVASPPLLGVCPGVKVKTPQGPIKIPGHPKDTTDVVAMIRRAQLIQKLKAREAAEKIVAAKATKVRAPISRITAKPVPQRGKLMRRLVLKKKVHDEKDKIVLPTSEECRTEPSKQSACYLEEVDRARKLAGIKSKATKQTSDYTSIKERVAALRAAKAKIQQGPTTRELTHKQHLKNRQQRQERKRLLEELERMRQQKDFNSSIEFAPIKTPPTARERLQAIKSRINTETPTTSAYPYSPVKTPDGIDIQQYQPLVLPLTPPYQFLENVCTSDIENISMPFDDLDDYELNTDYESIDAEDLEFQLAEAANAEESERTEFNECYNTQIEKMGLNDYDIAKRIENLHNQLLNSPDRADQYSIAARMEMLEEQLLRTPTTEQLPIDEANREYVCPDMPDLVDEVEQYEQNNIYDESTDDFETMERECI